MASKLILNSNESLKKGSQGVKVEQLQKILTELKLNPGQIDGDFGNKTVTAVQQFQQQQGLTPDGIVAQKTQDALNKSLENLIAIPNKPPKIAVVIEKSLDADSSGKSPLSEISLMNESLKKGSQGAKVEQLQKILTKLKLNPGQIDGNFGDKTVAAVKQFQNQKGLPADGVVGKNTQDALNNALGNLTANSTSSTLTPTSQQKGFGGATGKLPLPAIPLIKEFEGCYLDAYPDPRTRNLPITIGWGCTKKRDGSNWKLGESITQQEADDLLMIQLENSYLPPMQKIPVWSELNANQQGALLSFGYNLGAYFYGNFNFQSMTRVLRDKQWNEIEETFLKYRNPGSNVEAGLKRRRQAEAKLFLTPV